MIHSIKGNLLESDAEALVNTVNTVGVMGKGIALQFKKAFPNNFKAYKDACKAGEVQVGKLFVTKDGNLQGNKWIVNFPTKKHWRNPSKYEYIEEGLNDLVRVISQRDIKSIAIPPLGAGNGGLDWSRVKQMIEGKLRGLPIDIYLYEPGIKVEEVMHKERVKLTPARALLLYTLFDLQTYGEYPSEFSCEKICYFLQRCGGEQYFKLDYNAHFYGPYSGKVRHVLRALNGSYLLGDAGMDNKAFEPIYLIPETQAEVLSYIEKSPELKQLAEKTTTFLGGFYGNYELELLSSVDYIIDRERVSPELSHICTRLAAWSPRKEQRFSRNQEHVKIVLQHLQKYF